MKVKMNIFKQFFYAITNPKKYQEMTKLGGGRVFLYLLILSLFTSIIAFALPVATYFQVGGIAKVIENYIPDFQFKNNVFRTTLKINEEFDMDKFTTSDYDTSEISDKSTADEIRPYLIYTFAKEISAFDGNITSSTSSIKAERVMEEIEEATFYLLLDTSYDTVADALKDNAEDIKAITTDDIIIITKNDFTVFESDDIDKIVSKDEIDTFAYKDLVTEEINVDKKTITTTIKKLLPVFYIIAIVFFIFFILGTMLVWTIAGLFYSLITFIISKIAKKELDFSTLFKISIYAQTTVIIIKAILSYVPIPEIVLTYGGYLITIAYIIFVVMNFETNNYNSYSTNYDDENNNTQI